MRPLAITLTLAATCGVAYSQTSNLPPPEPGAFEAASSITINAPIEDVWHALLDFPSYPDWNPFVRSQKLADSLFIPLADQSTPHAGDRLIISVQTPPLPAPVNASTAPNPLHTQFSFENITFLEGAPVFRAAWQQIMIPDFLVNATRWQALSTLPNGSTFYEAREGLLGVGLQEGFDAQAAAFKVRVEGMQ
ncbi:hypothetical protein C8Q80DRAFT_1117465 [Daedaleopsis nitida]|nr:hypothetical protein C8Q80DRAFT_1117465 [Daedaleopsis nitida]